MSPNEAKEAKAKAVSKLLNAFPQTAGSFSLLLETYMEQLDQVSVEAVERSARRFRDNDVPDQSTRFAPSVAEFMTEVRRSEEYLARLSLPRKPAVEYRRSATAPFEIATERRRAANAMRAVIEENVSHERFAALSKANVLAVGAKWSCGTIYGPETSLF